MAAGKLAEACIAFEDSQKLQPAVTTLLNLAGCREKLGQLATAWGLFLDAVRDTRSATDAAGQQLHGVAQAHADKLEPRVSKLTISISPPSQVDGLVLLGALAGCPYPALSPLLPPDAAPSPPPPPPRESVEFPLLASRDLDLLFLIDDSPSMADKQANLASSFPKFIDVLSSIPGGLPSVHIGVVTSDMGTQAALDSGFGPAIGAGTVGACSGVGKDGAMQVFGQQVNGVYLSDIADSISGLRTRNYTGVLATVFGAIAKAAGAGGCGFEQPLATVKRALSNPANAGFLRDDAYLGVILITDEDDCSLAHFSLIANNSTASAQLGELQSFRCTRFGVLCDQGGQSPDAMNQPGAKDVCHPSNESAYLVAPGPYASFVRSLKTIPSKIFVAGITGNVQPVTVELRVPLGESTAIPALAHSCTYLDGAGMTEVADPAIRIKSFVDQFAPRSALASICAQDLSDPLQVIGDLARTAMGPPCFTGQLADQDPATAGTQYDCMVAAIDAQNPAPGHGLPHCDRDDASATNQPCWHIATDATACPKGSHLTAVIEGRGMLALDGYVTASCVLAPAG